MLSVEIALYLFLFLRNFRTFNDTKPVSVYYKANAVHLLLYMSSVTPEGDIVSTAKDTMKFLKAFFNGQFFPKEDAVL